MKVRNLPYDELNEDEKFIVREFWKDMTSEPQEYLPEEKRDVKIFWEYHREVDTQDKDGIEGQYEWTHPQKISEINVQEAIEEMVKEGSW